ncbi:MAG: murein hydrolase activator EnvC family protein [Flavobacteriaceae bacterium]|tara:strand:- start:18477 stop:19688 length:1212 start_codon:yes stop_codon:yes gene_type:complete
MKKYFFLFFLQFLNATLCLSQQETQKRLEKEKAKLAREIKQINSILFSNNTKKKSVFDELQDLGIKIQVRNKLIMVTNQEINFISKQININQRDIEFLRVEVHKLKEDYANMIRKSYYSKSRQSRLMFLFSSESFYQAYSRFKYLNQYAKHRKKQGETIIKKTNLLSKLNIELLSKKVNKESLIKENQVSQLIYQKEIEKQKLMIAELIKKQKDLEYRIRIKQKKIAAFDKEIERLIRVAIANANKKTSAPTNLKFSNTPEAKLVGKSFYANKGKLPWPVEEGVVIQNFGTQIHPVVRTTKIKSNGITIATTQTADARAIFKGIVMTVLSYKGSNPTVLVQHGNYITAYTNLESVYVKRGQSLSSKEKIGKVFTNPNTGKTELKFSIFQSSTPLNPKGWIYRL